MIPHTLQLKNFLSYGPEAQSINFTPYHLICLSGKNGHGKSALLDAITWAIWGQARKTSGNSKADQGLLHLGQNHMFVIIEFEVNGQCYRIRREYVQTKSKPFTSLDFGVMQEDKKFAPLTDKTIKSTQAKIEKTIGISYDSFISSAFLRQGQSNEFSKKSPKERKEVLAQILQLQQFDEQKKIALLQAKKLQIEYKTFTNLQQRIETELEQLATVPELHKKITSELKTIKAQQKKLEVKEQEIITNQKETLKASEKLELIQQQAQQSNLHLQQTKEQINIIAKQWHAQNQIVQKASNHKQLEKEEKELLIKLQSLQEKLQKKLILREEYLKVKEEQSLLLAQLEKTSAEKLQTLKLEQSKLQEQLLLQQRQLQQVEKQKNSINQELVIYNKEMKTTNDTLKKYQTAVNHHHALEQSLENLKTQYQAICSQGILQKKEFKKLNSILKEKKPNTLCPLCKHQLSDDGYSNITLEEQELQASLQQLKTEAQSIKQKISSAEKQVQQNKHQHEESINLTSKQHEQKKLLLKINQTLADLENQYQALKKEEKQLLNQKKEVDQQIKTSTDQHNQLNNDITISTLQKKLQKIEKTAKALGYDQKVHQETEQLLKEVQRQLLSTNNINDIIAEQAARKAELLTLFKSAQKYQTLATDLQKEIKKYQNIKPQIQKIKEQEASIKTEWQNLEKNQTKLLVEKGSLEQKQKKQKELYKELAKINKDIKIIQQEMIDYQEIAKALGKDGIQALLIEQAIPEIEDEANEVLARLTNNQTQVFIESLRDLKKGGNKETLDIKISDSFGLRDYELFSGGEAFRIDFALRIGISKLLARKAGTTLQTIIIDEGFGSQDEEGLQLIMDNIYKIQDEFAKVIIVSHLPEMKENFPVQFIVEKKRSGSSVSVIEQG